MKGRIIKNYFPNSCPGQFGKLSAFALIFCISFVQLNAQTYNYAYSYASVGIYKPKGNSIVETDASCGVAYVNSFATDDGHSDFQLTFLYHDGTFDRSYRFGAAGTNEICNGVCKSIDFSDEYLLCGQSANHQVLVMKVNTAGHIIWSKEITFSFENSEAINIFSMNNNPAEKGYVVVGNSNSTTGINSVAVAKLDENGNIIWSSEYNMGVKILETDAIPRRLDFDRIISITGFKEYNGIFYFNLYSKTGIIYPGTGATYNLQPAVPLFQPQLTEIDDQGNHHTIITFMRDASGFNSIAHYAMRTDGIASFTPIWKKKYSRTGQHGYINEDLATFSTNKLALLGSYSTVNGSGYVVNPYELELNFSGNVTGFHDYHLTAIESGISLIESCGTGYPIFNVCPFTPQNAQIRVIKKSTAVEPPCSVTDSWQQSSAPIVTENLPLTRLIVGTASNYPVSKIEVTPLRYDCTGNLAGRKANLSGAAIGNAKENASWFYPNPAHSKLQLQLGEQAEQVKLYDITGKAVFEGKLSGEAAIDLTELPAGVYFLERAAGQEITQRQKLIIN